MTLVKYILPVVLFFAAFTGDAAARDEPTRVLDIVFTETTRKRFEDIKLTFAAEQIFYDTIGDLIIQGTIVNHSVFTVDKVLVDCQARNRDGSMVASTRTYSFPHRLRPAQQGKVRIAFARHGVNIDRISYSLNAVKPQHARDAEQIGESLRYLPDMELSPFYAPMLR